jgi:Tol biopolymer transport system component
LSTIILLVFVIAGCSGGADQAPPDATPATQEPVPQEKRLTTSPATDIFPTWSPDSRHVAFVSDRDGNFEIYVMKSDGSDILQFTSTQTNPGNGRAAWSKDGSRIAWDFGSEIYVMNADGSAQTRLTDDRFSDLAPSWSPDGRRLAIWSSRDSDWEIYTMNADGSGGLTRVTYSPGSDSQPAWSPDGKRIAFTSFRDRNLEIYVVNVDGSGTTRLTNDLADDSDPAWSADSTQIAFTSERDGNAEIYVMNADGSGLARLTQNSADDRAPSWSPDGGQVVFASNRDGNYEIYLIDSRAQVAIAPTPVGRQPTATATATVPQLGQAASVPAGLFSVQYPTEWVVLQPCRTAFGGDALCQDYRPIGPVEKKLGERGEVIYSVAFGQKIDPTQGVLGAITRQFSSFQGMSITVRKLDPAPSASQYESDLGPVLDEAVRPYAGAVVDATRLPATAGNRIQGTSYAYMVPVYRPCLYQTQSGCTQWTGRFWETFITYRGGYEYVLSCEGDIYRTNKDGQLVSQYQQLRKECVVLFQTFVLPQTPSLPAGYSTPVPGN